MSWLRRLFSRGGEAARWQKLLAPTPGHPHIDLLVSLLSPDDAAVGPLARLALGLGALSHEILEEKVGSITASLQPAERASIERAQARLWLQASVPHHLEAEWKPVIDISDVEAHKRALLQVDRALGRLHGAGPGEAALARWLKGLAAEVGPLAEGKGPTAALPPSLALADHEARGPHFDQAGFVENTQAAVSWIVFVANRLAEAFTSLNPDKAALTAALGSAFPEPSPSEVAAQRERWTAWIAGAREQALTRGRNPKPAFLEGEGGEISEQRLASITKVMSLADLPPEAAIPGAPPLPELSGPHVPPPPAVTQEVSLAQIEAEARAAAFPAPAMTQEVSIAQIEAEQAAAEGFVLPAHTQEVSSAQLVDEGSPAKAASITQPIPADQVAAANAEDAARRGALPPTLSHNSAEAGGASDHVADGANGVHLANGANGTHGVPHGEQVPAALPRPEDGPPRE